MSMDNVPVVASATSDLILGLDWFQFVRHSASNITVHLSGGPLDLRRPLLPIIGSQPISTVSPPGAPVFRGNTGVDGSASTLVAQARTPRTRGIQPPRTRGAAPCTQGVQNFHDNVTAINNSGANELLLLPSSNEDPFVRLTEQEKNTVVHYLALEKRVPVAVLRSMASCHQNLNPVLSPHALPVLPSPTSSLLAAVGKYVAQSGQYML
ncbi:hypothetical protein B0H13DRAFT_1850568 [Mycena leptocephala]|nr:hypothetical protein B0H13DRAFT_1850568 [Mycena leptocephala]